MTRTSKLITEKTNLINKNCAATGKKVIIKIIELRRDNDVFVIICVLKLYALKILTVNNLN